MNDSHKQAQKMSECAFVLFVLGGGSTWCMIFYMCCQKGYQIAGSSGEWGRGEFGVKRCCSRKSTQFMFVLRRPSHVFVGMERKGRALGQNRVRVMMCERGMERKTPSQRGPLLPLSLSFPSSLASKVWKWVGRLRWQMAVAFAWCWSDVEPWV